MCNEVSFFDGDFIIFISLGLCSKRTSKAKTESGKTHSVDSEIHKHEVREYLSGRWRRKEAKGQEEESECECEQGREG